MSHEATEDEPYSASANEATEDEAYSVSAKEATEDEPYSVSAKEAAEDEQSETETREISEKEAEISNCKFETTEKLNTCLLCNKSFKHKNSLKVHMRRHT